MFLGKSSLVFLLLLSGCSEYKEPESGDLLEAVVKRVIDGDTISVTVPAWKGTPVENISIRVYGIDTPEKSSRFAKCEKEENLGIKATEFARTLAKKGDKIKFVYRNPDKYFRIDADVYTPNGKNWADLMISKGYAYPYDGKTKRDWCR